MHTLHAYCCLGSDMRLSGYDELEDMDLVQWYAYLKSASIAYCPTYNLLRLSCVF